MRADFFKSLYFSELVDQLKWLERFFHAFYGNSFLRYDMDRLNDLRKAALAFLAQ